MKATPPPPPEPTPPADAEPRAADAPLPDGAIPVPPPAPPPAADPATPATWPAWFRAADVVAAVLVLVPAFLVASFAARNSDLWPHLAVGRLIAHGEYAFGTDPLSYATADRPWVNHSWLFDLGAYLLYNADPSGAALVAVKAVGFAAAVALLMLIRRPGHALWPWVIFAALAVVAAAPHTSVRPLVASAVLLAATLYVLLGTEWRPGSWRNPLVLGGLFWLWANVDGWFVLGPLTVVVVLLGEWLNRLVLAGDAPVPDDPFNPPAALPDLAKALGVGVLACMLNPHHVRVWQLPGDLGGIGLPAAVTADKDYAALTLSPLSALYTEGPQLGYNLNGLAYALLLLGGGVALVAGFGKVRLSHLLLWLGFAFLSLQYFRLILFFAVAAVPIAAGAVNGISARFRLGPKARSSTQVLLTLSGLARVLTIPALLVLAAAAWPGWLHPRPADPATAARVAWAVQPDPGPVRTATMIRDWRQSGRLPAEFRGVVLNQDVANYFAWFAPGEKVFANGRYQYHGPELVELSAARKDFQRARQEGEAPDFSDVRRLCERYQAAYVVYTDGGNQSRAIDLVPPLTMVYSGREWVLWHVDGRAAVIGWVGRRPEAPAAFDRLTFDPVRLAFDPGQTPLPEPKVVRPPDPAPEWWEAFTRVPEPTPIAVQDSQVWVSMAETVRRQQLRPFLASLVPVGLATGGGLVAPIIRSNQPPLPAPPDAALALQTLAGRAARRAIAANPDNPDPYLVLAIMAGNRDLALPGENPRELLFVQVAGYRQCLDRLPPPASGLGTQVADVGRTAAGALSELYRNPTLTADLGQLRFIDLSREMVKVAVEYAVVGSAAIKDPEDRKRFLEAANRMKAQANDEYTRQTDAYELYVKTENPKPPQRMLRLLQLGLAGRAIQEFKAANPDEFGQEGFGLALMLVRIKIRAGMVAEAAEDLGYLEESLKGGESTPDRQLSRQFARPLREIQMELWRVTGDYGKLMDALKAGTPQERLSPQARELVATAVAGGERWRGVVVGVNGAVGGGVGAFTGAEMMRVGFAPVPLLVWLSEVQFYLHYGLLAVLDGDIPDAKTRFTQALRPQGVELPAFRPERVAAERYLRMIAAGEAAK